MRAPKNRVCYRYWSSIGDDDPRTWTLLHFTRVDFTLPVFVEVYAWSARFCARRAASLVTSEKFTQRELSLHQESASTTLKAVIQQRLDDGWCFFFSAWHTSVHASLVVVFLLISMRHNYRIIVNTWSLYVIRYKRKKKRHDWWQNKVPAFKKWY